MTEKTQKTLVKSILSSIAALSEIGCSVNRGLTLCKARLIQRILRRTINDLKAVDAVIADFIESEITAERNREIPAHVIIGAIKNLTKEYAEKNAANSENAPAVGAGT